MGGKKFLSAKEKQLVGLVVFVVAAIAVLMFMLGYMLFTKFGAGNKNNYSQQYETDGVVSDSLQGYIQMYFQEDGTEGVVSDAVMERIVAEITTGVLNSLPNVIQSDEDTVTYIRKMISASVTEEIQSYNEEYLSSGGYEYTTTLSSDLLYYIDNVIIPGITAELQIDEGEVKDLIETLVNSSDVYKENTKHFETLIKEIEQELKVINVESSTYEEDIVELINNLKEMEVVLADYKSQTAVQITNYDTELSAVKKMVQEYYALSKEYTDAEVAIIKEELDAALADMENNESVKNIIQNIEIKNEQDLLELEQILKEEIYNNNLANTEELENIVTVLNETITGLQSRISLLSITLETLTARQLEDLRQSLQDQIDANITLTETQKKDLEASIEKVTTDASLSVAETKKALEEDIKEKTDANTEALNRFIDSLYGDADNRITIEGILSQIKESNELSAEQKDALTEMIEAKYADMAGNITTQVGEIKSELQKEIIERNKTIDSVVISLTTSLETKVAELEKRVNKLISNQIDTLKNNLLIQIQNNKDLSEEQKAELEEEISNLAQNATTAEDLNKAVAELTEKIAQNSEENKEALKDAIDELLGDGFTTGITIAELEKRIEDADISEEEKKQLLDAIAKVYADATADTAVKVDEAKEALQKEIDLQNEKFTNAVISLQTELEIQIANIEARLTKLTEAQIETVKNNLLLQIQNNKELSEEQKEELENEILNLAQNSATAEGLSAAIAELTAKIAQSTEANRAALNKAINDLLGEGSTDGITIAELEKRIAEADISDEEKLMLNEAIAKVYTDATADTIVKIGEAKESLREEINDQAKAFTIAVTSLETEIEVQIANIELKLTKLTEAQIETVKNNLLLQIQNNKELSDVQKAELEDEILKLAEKSATADDLSAAIAELNIKISQNMQAGTEALNEAINRLLGDGATTGITIADLEERISEADISDAEKKKINDAMAKVYADAGADTIVKVAEAKTALQEEINRQAEAFAKAVSLLETELEEQIANIEARLRKLTEEQIETVKNNLLLQIQNNKELSDEQKAELEGEILNLANKSATAEGLSEAVAELTAKIAQSTEANRQALNQAIKELLGEGSTEGITIAELERRIAKADISDEEKKMLNDAIAKVYTDTAANTTVKVGEVREALQKEINEQAAEFTKAVTSLQTEMEVQIANIEIRLTKLTETQIESLKNNLLLQIQSNKELSDEQKAELEKEILNLARKSATAEELSAAIADLTAKISQSTQDSAQALMDAINNLLGEGSTEGITIAELEERIANADISEEEKKKLNDAISEVYANATADTTVKVGEAREALQKEIENQAERIANAMSSLQLNLEMQIANLEAKLSNLTEVELVALRNSLEAQILENKELSDEQKAELEREILNLAQKSATKEELNASVADLTAKISQNAKESTEELTNTINNLLGEGSTEGITIAELEERIANADISEKEKKKLNDAILEAYANATDNTTVKVGEAREALQAEIIRQAEALTDAMSSLQMDLEIQIANLEARLTDLTETQLKALKNSLEDQILANTELSLKQKEELLEEIADLESSTANTVLELEATINAKAKENADALSNFIRTLYGDASGDITIGEILDQIEANTKLTNDQKRTLTDLIEKRYKDATDNTTLRVEDAKTVLQEEIDMQVETLNNAVDDLMDSLESEVNDLNTVINANKATQDAINTNQANTNQSLSNKDSQLESSINANKTAQDAINTNQANTNQNLQNQLDSITSSLEGDCEIKYVNGEFIVYNPEGTVSKKLVFAE